MITWKQEKLEVDQLPMLQGELRALISKSAEYPTAGRVCCGVDHAHSFTNPLGSELLC